jgi:hypothetical protein
LLQRRRAYRLLNGLLARDAVAPQTAEQDSHELVTNEINSSEVVTNGPLNKEKRPLRGRSRLRKQGP